MARQEINLGVLPNGVGGDTPRVANTKINDMTAELYAAIENFPGGAVKTVAGVNPDAAGDIPKAPLATALGVDAKADKTDTEAALDLKADKAAVNTALSEKADKTALDSKVDKAAGKGLSSNDFTTTEKTKLSALSNLKEQGIGVPGILVPDGDLNKALAYGNYAVKPSDANGKNVYGFLEVITYDSGSILQRLTITRGHPTGEISWFRSVSGNAWTEWFRFITKGDFGAGADPRAGSVQQSVRAISDANVLEPSGTYLVHSETLNSPKVYGTFRMEWYDVNGWTQTITQINTGEVWTRGCINGSIGTWKQYYPVKNFRSADLTYTNGQLQNVQHSLGAIPTKMQLFAYPIMDQVSWSAGIRVVPASGYTIGADPSLIFIKVATGGMTVIDAQTGASVVMTPANWRIEVRASI